MDAGDILALVTVILSCLAMVFKAAKKVTDKKPQVVSKPLKELIDILGDSGNDVEEEEEEMPVLEQRFEPQPFVEGQKALVREPAPVIKSSEAEVKKEVEKIDKKKLIIYSEILKPKFDD